MNFTLDDTASQLIYLPGAWGVQVDGDPALSSFFGRTYHAAQVDGASVNMSVGCTDVYLWGSKGPRHVRLSLLPGVNFTEANLMTSLPGQLQRAV